VTEQGDTFSAFISHAHQDAATALAVCSLLESRGLRCWVAPRDVRPGAEYSGEIIRGIRQSRSLVLLLSRAANDSRFVRLEVERAISNGKPVFPLRLEDVLPGPALELFVGPMQWIDAWQGNLETHAERLADRLRDPGARDSAAPDPPASRFWRRRAEHPARTSSRRLFIPAAATVATLLVLGAVAWIALSDRTPRESTPESENASTPAAEPREDAAAGTQHARTPPEGIARTEKPPSATPTPAETIPAIERLAGLETLTVTHLAESRYEVAGPVINDAELETLRNRLESFDVHVTSRATRHPAAVRSALESAIERELDVPVRVTVRNENEVYGPSYLLVVFEGDVDRHVRDAAEAIAKRFAYDPTLIRF